MTASTTLLINLFYNLIGHRSKRQLVLIVITFYVAIRSHFRKKQKLKDLQQIKKIKIKDQPLITFSGGGQLGFYYQGICAYLRDNFDLDDVRFAGMMIFYLLLYNIICNYFVIIIHNYRN